MSTLYFNHPACQVLADPAGFLRCIWSPGERTPAQLSTVFDRITQGLRSYGWSKIRIDQRRMRAFTTAEQQWIAAEWLPRAVREGGYRYGAILVSDDVFTRLATAYVTTSVQNLPLVYRTFTEEAAAVAWLRAQP